jgi:hypothetical protein
LEKIQEDQSSVVLARAIPVARASRRGLEKRG